MNIEVGMRLNVFLGGRARPCRQRLQITAGSCECREDPLFAFCYERWPFKDKRKRRLGVALSQQKKKKKKKKKKTMRKKQHIKNIKK
eukprot:NODE_17729_length_928_cov_4.579276.p3 GENE.NODE_17729_length_928_cov_4.579276~~NODE_17729_length_928_cov_4.579276.p3  ORF type:complete len:87 (-),score=21.90 NODE_17729_length_928_cov_4.579276:44-304(-)